MRPAKLTCPSGTVVKVRRASYDMVVKASRIAGTLHPVASETVSLCDERHRAAFTCLELLLTPTRQVYRPQSDSQPFGKEPFNVR
jgi:hypothetical protein